MGAGYSCLAAAIIRQAKKDIDCDKTRGINSEDARWPTRGEKNSASLFFRSSWYVTLMDLANMGITLASEREGFRKGHTTKTDEV